MKEYKVVGIRYPLFGTKDKNGKRLQEVMNTHAKDGWRVHLMNIADLNLFYITFERDI